MGSQPAELIDAVQRVGERFASLVSSADPAARAVGATWSVGEVAAHVVSVVPRYSRFPRGEQSVAASPAELPALNEAELRAVAPGAPAELGDRVRGAVADLAEDIHHYGKEPPSYAFHGGGVVRADSALGILLGELLVHGWDVAHAVGASWLIEAADVERVWNGVEPILPGWVNPQRAAGHTASYRVRLAGAGTHDLNFDSGVVQSQRARPVDCHIAGDAGTILLVLYRRRTAAWALRHARVVAWGRRPWLAFSLADRFYEP